MGELPPGEGHTLTRHRTPGHLVSITQHVRDHEDCLREDTRMGNPCQSWVYMRTGILASSCMGRPMRLRQGQHRAPEIGPSGIEGGLAETWAMVEL